MFEMDLSFFGVSHYGMTLMYSSMVIVLAFFMSLLYVFHVLWYSMVLQTIVLWIKICSILLIILIGIPRGEGDGLAYLS